LLRGWHRDVGYLVFGLTVAYAISGIAVNHHHQWDYNERTLRTRFSVGGPAKVLPNLSPERHAALTANPTAVTDEEAARLTLALGSAVGHSEPPRNHFWRGPDRLLAFYGEGDREVLEYSPSSGVAELIQRHERALLRDLNYLHLNEQRGWWTWVADSYAALLLFLAVSGALIVRGRKGLRGRGGLLLATGIVLPLLGVLVLRYL
jgi:hypothetical protein